MLRSHWKVFTGNEIGALLGWWLFYIHPTQKAGDPQLAYVASTVSSKMLRSIARKEGLRFEETLTGFKWMGNRAWELEKSNSAKILLGFEEAIGFMCGTTVLDKDGVSALIRALELISHLNKNGCTLNDKLLDLYKTYVRRNDDDDCLMEKSFFLFGQKNFFLLFLHFFLS